MTASVASREPHQQWNADTFKTFKLGRPWCECQPNYEIILEILISRGISKLRTYRLDARWTVKLRESQPLLLNRTCDRAENACVGECVHLLFGGRIMEIPLCYSQRPADFTKSTMCSRLNFNRNKRIMRKRRISLLAILRNYIFAQ